MSKRLSESHSSSSSSQAFTKREKLDNEIIEKSAPPYVVAPLNEPYNMYRLSDENPLKQFDLGDRVRTEPKSHKDSVVAMLKEPKSHNDSVVVKEPKSHKDSVVVKEPKSHKDSVVAMLKEAERYYTQHSITREEYRDLYGKEKPQEPPITLPLPGTDCGDDFGVADLLSHTSYLDHEQASLDELPDIIDWELHHLPLRQEDLAVVLEVLAADENFCHCLLSRDDILYASKELAKHGLARNMELYRTTHNGSELPNSSLLTKLDTTGLWLTSPAMELPSTEQMISFIRLSDIQAALLDLKASAEVVLRQRSLDDLYVETINVHYQSVCCPQ